MTNRENQCGAVIDYTLLYIRLKAMGMKVSRLVKFAGITSNNVVSISQGKPIPMNAALKLCKAFDCELSDLMRIDSYADENGLEPLA